MACSFFGPSVLDRMAASVASCPGGRCLGSMYAQRRQHAVRGWLGCISEEPALREQARCAHIGKVMRLFGLGTADEPPGAQFAFAHRQTSRCVVGCVFVSFARFDCAMPVLDGRRAGPGDIIAQADFRNGVQGWTVDGIVSSKVFQCDADRHLRVMLRWPGSSRPTKTCSWPTTTAEPFGKSTLYAQQNSKPIFRCVFLASTALQVLCIV
jgi:hypothetical protein